MIVPAQGGSSFLSLIAIALRRSAPCFWRDGNCTFPITITVCDGKIIMGGARVSQQKVEVVQDYSKPVAEVFAYLADHNNLGTVFGIPVRRVRDGSKDVNGVGSVRRLGFGPLAVEETVTALTRNRSIDYRISKGGFPIRNHSGRLQFTGSERGARVAWTIEFDSALPLVGTAVKLVLGQAIRLGLKRV
jgi:hypothetical protein